MADAIHFSLMPAPLLHPRRHQCLSNHDVLTTYCILPIYRLAVGYLKWQNMSSFFNHLIELLVWFLVPHTWQNSVNGGYSQSLLHCVIRIKDALFVCPKIMTWIVTPHSLSATADLFDCRILHFIHYFIKILLK